MGCGVVGVSGGMRGDTGWMKTSRPTFRFFGGTSRQPPAMPQVRRGFKRPIVSRVIVLCDFDRVLRVSMRLQLIERCVIAMRQYKTGTLFLCYQDLPEVKRRSNAVDNFLNLICHCSDA